MFQAMTRVAGRKAVTPLFEELLREQLLNLLEELDEGGVHIQFGKANARGLARRVRPRVLKPMRKYSCRPGV